MTNNGLARVVAALLFAVAGVLLIVHAAPDWIEPLALFGLAAWALAGGS